MINKLGCTALVVFLSFNPGCGDDKHPPGATGTDAGPDSGPQSAALAVSVDSSQLTDVPVGATRTFTVTITNQGPGEATLGTLTNAGLGLAAPFSVAEGGSCASGAALAAGASCTLVLAYTPTALGASSGTLHFPDAAGHDTAVALTGSARAFTFTSGQAASVVIGQDTFVTNGGDTTATTLYGPWGDPSIYNGVLYVTDWDNSRILGYHGVPTTNGHAADFVIGQTNFTSYTPGTSASNVRYPWSSSGGEGVFAVADTSNNRVLLFNPAPTTTSPSASVVLGQTAFDTSVNGCTASSLYGPTAVSIGGGKLVVADYSNNRVLIWNVLPTATTNPDLVIGQPDFTTCTANTGGVSATAMAKPGDVWTNGQVLIVADAGNHRVLVWKTFPTTNDQAADLVLGQATFADASANRGGSVSASGIDASGSHWGNVTSNGVQIFYSDYNNSRILIWNQIPTSNGAAADVVLGQADMTSSATPDPPTAASLGGVGGVTFYANQFFVTDYGNNRVLIFNGQ